MPTVWGEKRGPDTLFIYAKHRDALADLFQGDRLRIVVEKDRNGKFNALYHVMLSLIVKAVNSGPASTSIDALKRWVKLKTGAFDVVELPKPTTCTATGEVITTSIEYHSTSFAAMGEEEFHRFAVDTVDLIRAELAPWIDRSDEWPEIIKIMASISPAEAA